MHRPHKIPANAGVAQLVEHFTRNLGTASIADKSTATTRQSVTASVQGLQGFPPTERDSDAAQNVRSEYVAFYDWLAGFIDGEGCFTITLRPRRATLTLKVRDDEEPIIREIQERTGIGSVQSLRAYGNSAPQVAWIVASAADRLALIEILEAHPLRAKKRHDFHIWREAHCAIGLWDDELLAELNEALKAGRKYPVKWEHFCAECQRETRLGADGLCPDCAVGEPKQGGPP